MNKSKIQDGIFSALSAEEMNPAEFKTSYKGPYSHYFRYVKDMHNRYLGIKTLSRLLKIWKKQNYYGIIYKITQFYDKNSNKLYDGGTLISKGKKKKNGKIRIGRSFYFYDRLKIYNHTSKNNPKYHFESALAKYGWRAFRIEILAICKTWKEYKATECFWTLYFNRESSPIGYNLRINGYFNPIIGSWSDTVKAYFLPNWELTKFVLKGWNKKNIKEYYSKKYHLDHLLNEKTINNAFSKVFGTSSLRHAQIRLIKPVLDICFKRGYDINQTLDFIKKCGFDWFKASLIYNKKRLGKRFILKIYGDLRENKETSKQSYYDAVKEILFIQPFVEYLKKIGILEMLPMFKQEEVLIKDYSGKIVGRKEISFSKWSIIEYLYVTGIGLVDIAIAIGKTSWNSSLQDRQKARISIERYLYNRWDYLTCQLGGKKLSIIDIKNFLKIFNLGQANYLSFIEKNNF